jgi:hypothetical protein
MKHIIFYSGGVGSWATAKRVAAKHGTQDLVLLFTDTLIEDKDLYRFLIETAGEIYGIDVRDLSSACMFIPPVSHESMEDRKSYLLDLARHAQKRIPNLAWIADGRDPWEVFKKERWIGNSRIAPCSHILKQETAEKFIKKYFFPETTTLYMGIDWTEEHRTKAPQKNWAPYLVEFPMCEEPYVVKDEMLQELVAVGIRVPDLYLLGFSHNNCGGFCCRAGQGHFANLLEKKPELFRYHEEKEEEMRQYLGKDTSMMTKQKKKVKFQYTLRNLREDIQGKSCEIDMNDIGGCGCFVMDGESE